MSGISSHTYTPPLLLGRRFGGELPYDILFYTASTANQMLKHVSTVLVGSPGDSRPGNLFLHCQREGKLNLPTALRIVGVAMKS